MHANLPRIATFCSLCIAGPQWATFLGYEDVFVTVGTLTGSAILSVDLAVYAGPLTGKFTPLPHVQSVEELALIKVNNYITCRLDYN